MIVDPPINELLDKVECRYSLVVVVSKRARQIVSGDAPLIDIDLDEKPVSIAAKEMYADKLTVDSGMRNTDYGKRCFGRNGRYCRL